jgi:hypothetical protein
LFGLLLAPYVYAPADCVQSDGHYHYNIEIGQVTKDPFTKGTPDDENIVKRGFKCGYIVPGAPVVDNSYSVMSTTHLGCTLYFIYWGWIEKNYCGEMRYTDSRTPQGLSDYSADTASEVIWLSCDGLRALCEHHTGDSVVTFGKHRFTEIADDSVPSVVLSENDLVLCKTIVFSCIVNSNSPLAPGVISEDYAYLFKKLFDIRDTRGTLLQGSTDVSTFQVTQISGEPITSSGHLEDLVRCKFEDYARNIAQPTQTIDTHEDGRVVVTNSIAVEPAKVREFFAGLIFNISLDMTKPILLMNRRSCYKLARQYAPCDDNGELLTKGSQIIPVERASDSSGNASNPVPAEEIAASNTTPTVQSETAEQPAPQDAAA